MFVGYENHASGENATDCSFAGLVGGTERVKSIQNNRRVSEKR